jgi:hypothetical protein
LAIALWAAALGLFALAIARVAGGAKLPLGLVGGGLALVIASSLVAVPRPKP